MTDATQQEVSLLMEELSEMLAPVIATSTFSNLIPLATYILVALSFYTIAKRREIANPWLAWIPVAQLWILGSISDGYQLAANEKHTARRKWLIGLNLVQVALAIVVVVMAVVAIVGIIGAGYTSYDDPELVLAAVGGAGGLVLVLLLVAAVSIATTVLQYVALYDVYRSCDPANATLFLVLNIIISVTQPILLMVVRNKDEGMPRAAAPAPAPSEPWDLT